MTHLTCSIPGKVAIVLAAGLIGHLRPCHAEDDQAEPAPLDCPVCLRMPSIEVPVYVANPRDAGVQLNIVNTGVVIAAGDASALGEHPSRKVFHYHLFVGQVVEFEDGSLKVPDLVRRVNYATHEGTRPEMQDPIDDNIASGAHADWWLPYGKKFKKLHLVVWGRDEKTGWRMFDAPLTYTKRIVRLDIPDLLTLPKLEDHPRGKQMWSVLMEAQKAFEDRAYRNVKDRQEVGILRLIEAPPFKQRPGDAS